MLHDDIELAMIREFSTANNQIGKSKGKAERRERLRQAIYEEKRTNDPFYDQPYSYSEAFRLAFGERLDRRAATRALPEPDDDGTGRCRRCGTPLPLDGLCMNCNDAEGDHGRA